MSIILGHRIVGAGPHRVVVLNDWISDTTSWEMCRPLIDEERSSWAFVDLRGYGRSRAIAGEHTLIEAAADVLRTASALGWERFAVAGHSMSSLVALHLGQLHSKQIERLVVIAPPPPAGLGAGGATLEFLRSVALGDTARRLEGLRLMWGDRLSPGWIRFKAAQWQETADPQAAAAYVDMFARHGMPDARRAVQVPVLAITGEQDAEVMRSAAVHAQLSSLCPHLLVQSIAEAGHYPMQEAPPMTITQVERFLLSSTSAVD